MRYRLISLLLVFSFCIVKVYSQEEKQLESLLKKYGKIDLGFSGLGFSFETPLSTKVLLESSVGLGAGYLTDEGFKYRMYFNNPSVYASIAAKYYINLDSRRARRRGTYLNAGNFFALKTKYTSPNIRKEKTWKTLLVALHWGMQRQIKHNFSYQLTVGVGSAINLDNKSSKVMNLYPDFNLRCSYSLPF